MTAAQAMILAAGRGERMRPLTDNCPKPLLEVLGKPLIQYHLEALARSGFGEVVVNTAWLGEQIESRFGATRASTVDSLLSKQKLPVIRYSHEGRDFGGALETGGGIARALPLLDEVFWVLAGDVYVPGFEFSRAAYDRFAAGRALAHLWLVPNPPHNLKGDFGVDSEGLALNRAKPAFTYSTIGLFRRDLLRTLPFGNPEGIKASIVPSLRAAMDQGEVSAEIYPGPWTDVGTPQRLAELNADAQAQGRDR